MSGLEIFSYEINGFHKSRRFITKARRFAMNNNISERNQCYGITITADGVDKNGNAFHNAIADVIDMLMAIVSHYSRYAVRWRLQAERGKQTRRLHYQAFIDFGCEIKLRTALSYMPVGTHLEPVRNTTADASRAADYAIKDDTRCDDDDADLDGICAGPYSYGFDDDFDVSKEMRMIDVQDDVCDAIAMADDAGVDMTALHDAVMASIKAMTDAALRARVCAYTRAGEDSYSDSRLVEMRDDGGAAYHDPFDDLFDDDDDVDTAAAGDVASASDAAAANSACSHVADAAELARIDAADVSSMTPAEQAAFFAPLFADDDADDDASMFAGDDTAASADAFDVDSLDAEIADSFADDAAGACVHIASKPVHKATAVAAVVNNAGDMNDDGMSDADFAAMTAAFAMPLIDESQAYLDTMMLSKR